MSRSAGWLLFGVIALLASGALAQGPPPMPARDTTPIVGQPRILSTATLVIQNKRVVLFGVDPWVKDQPCFDRNDRKWDCATAAYRTLMNMIGREPVTCHPKLQELGGRIYGQCFVTGKDIGLALVEAGMAVTVPSETQDYETAQETARAKKAGAWQGRFLTPAEHRKVTAGDEVQPRG